jgi:hypothetical protein
VLNNFEFECFAVFGHETDPFELDLMSNFCGSVQFIWAFLLGRNPSPTFQQEFARSVMI